MEAPYRILEGACRPSEINATSRRYMTEYQGTENLLALAKRLREVAPNVRDAISMKLGASLMESAASAIERLAHFEPNIEAGHGEN